MILFGDQSGLGGDRRLTFGGGERCSDTQGFNQLEKAEPSFKIIELEMKTESFSVR